ncbi:MAG: ABC transporter permease [Syntrophales bacterium]
MKIDTLSRNYWSILNELKATFRYRYVVYNFVYYSLKQRYTRSTLGFLWSILTPLLQSFIMGIFFFYLMRIDMPNYIVHLFAGTVIYNIIGNVIIQSPSIMLINENFIKKIYVPKLVFVLQVVFLEIINFILTLFSLVILGILFRKISLSLYYLFLPVPIVLIVFFSIGIAIILSIATIYFRDMNYIVPVVMQAAFFLTPVIYPMSMVPENVRTVIEMNPLYYFVEIFRSPIMNNQFPPWNYLLICTAMAFAAFSLGLFLLNKYNNKIIFKL